MKKNFLLLLLLTLLPTAIFAATYNNVSVQWTPTTTSTAFTGGAMALPVPTLRSGGSNLPTSAYTVTWKYNGGSTVTVADHAGTYTATITATSGNTINYGYGSSGSHTYNVTKVNNTVSVPSFAEGDSWEYGQTPHIPASSALGGATVTFEISANGTSGWQSFSNLTETSVPNTWYVRAKAASTVDYNETTSATTQITITKAKVYVTPGNETAMWRDPFTAPLMSNINPTVVGDVDWSVAQNYLKWNQLVPVEKAEASYEYTLESNGTSNNYYEFIVSGNGTVNITKNNEGSIAGGGNGADLEYDGTPQTLEPGTACAYLDGQGNEAGKVEYRIIAPAAAATEWSEDIPTATDAETYTVEVRGVGDQNHEDYYDPADAYTVFIDKTDPTITITSVGGAATSPEFTYDAPDFNTANFTYDYDFTGYDGTPDTYAFTKDGNPAAWDGSAGDWTVAVTFTEGTNWNAATTAPFAFTVGKAENEFTTDPEEVADWQYDAATHDLLSELGAVKGGAKIHYHIIYTPFVGSGNYELDTDVMPTGEDAGTYQISYYADECDNYLAIAETDLAVVTVSKATLTVDGVAGKDNLVYTGGSQSILKHGAEATTSYGPKLAAADYSVSYTGGETSPVNAYGNVKQTNAGKYTITYQVTPTDQNNFATPDPATAEAVIDLAPLNFGVNGVNTVWADGVTYTWDEICSQLIKSDNWLASEDADAKALILSKGLSVTVNGASDPAAGDFKKMLNGDAGTYKVEFTKNTLDADKPEINYDIELWNWTVNVVIDKADIVAADFTAPVAADLYYTGEAQDLTTAGEMLNAYGEIQFATAEDGTYSTTIPQGTDADDYEVWFKIVGDDNHNDFAPVQVANTKIKQAANAITNLALEGWTYGEEANEPVADATFKAEGEPTFTYSDSETGTFTDEVPTDAGTWYVKASVEETTNWAAAEKTISFVIDKADATCEAPEANELTYNGDDQALVVEPTYNGGTIQYSLDGTTWSEDIPTGKDADTYEVYYKVVGDANHYDFIATEPVEVAIAPKALDIAFFVFSADEATYNFEDQKPTYELLSTEPIADTDYDEVSDAEMINVGEYTFTFTGKANYTGTVEFTFTINKKDQDVVAPKKINLTYNGKNQTLVEAGTTDADGLVYAIGDGEFGELDVLPEAKDAGTYTVKYAYVENDNFNAAEGGEVEVTIEKATIGYMLGGMTKVWDGEPITEEANGEQLEQVFTLYAGELFEEDVYDVPFTLSLPEDYRDADDYTFTAAEAQEGVAFKEGYPVNYKINFSGSGNVVIKKADIADDDFDAPTAVEEALTYKNGTAQDLVVAGEVTAKTAADYPNEELAGKPFGTIMYASAKDGEYSETAPKGEAADDYEVWYYVKGDKNHNDTDPVKIEKSIAPKAMTFALQFADATETYSGEDFMPADVVAYDGETALEADKDYTLEITDDATELVNAGTYVFTYTGIGNYEGSSAEATIVIEKKALAADMFVLSAETATYNGTDQKPEVTVKEGEPIVAADYTVAADETMVDADTYTFTFTAAEDGNYSGEITKEFVIAKKEAIAIAADAEKVYDGTPDFKDLPVLTFKNLELADDPAEVFAFGADAFVFTDLTANAGTYAFTVDVEKIVADNYYVSEANGANFTISKANLMVNWNTEADAFTKVYGAEDPELVATTANLDIAGAVPGEEDAIAAGTAITRAEGEAVGKYAITLAADPNAEVFANYNAQFEGYAEGFVITPATVKVSIASLDKVYDGEAATIDVKAEDLIVTGLQNGDKKEDIFTTLPTATVGSGEEKNVGTYEVTLDGAEAADYEVEYMTSSFAITPLEITTAKVAAQKVQQGKVLDETAFTVEGVPAVDAEYFYVAAPGLADFDGTVTGDAGIYADGLVLAVDDEVADNYVLGTFTGELEIIAAEAIILADNEDFVTEAKTGVDVTFADRSINAGTWNVLALPFEATVKQISDAFGYAAVDILNEDGNTPGEVHFKVISSGTIPAYTPFIIKTTEDAGLAKDNFNQVVFHNVNIEACDGTNNSVEDAAQNKFWGTFQAVTTFYGAQYWYMSKGAWKDASKYTASKPVSLKAFRAYVEFKDVPAEGARIFVEEPDGTITAINGLEFNKAMDAEGWFTVNGMKLDEAPAQKGTYIKDGKKVIVK